MMSLERRTGKTVKVMPDFIRINEPKDDDVQSIVPGVQFHRNAGMPDAAQ